jgi:16S rRNA C967 or C1407 C5-methylase (RsmB/RsmF family)
VIVPAPAKGVKSVKNVKNALRSAQLDKAQLLMWRKFGYGEQLFAQYYGKQGLFPRDELPAVTGAFATPLPITFRLHATDPRAASLAARLRELADRRPNPLVRSLPWMPEGEGWQALLMDEAGGGSGEWGEVVKEGRGRGAAEHAADGSHTYIGRREKLHEEVAAVVREGTAAGLLARQEAVSMLPVLVLAPALPLRAGSRVLDVCAAPGNKTMQLLERCAPPPARGITGGGGGGIVVANDAHPGRVKTLHEAIARHCRRPGEMAALVITCALGQNIPVPTFEDGGGGSGCPRVVRGYDAVLTDVPCSGDGTLRKDPDVLRRWHPGGGNCLHATQLAVAQRAAALVRPGGALLYSTCSLNPVEDEAVVAGILTGPGGDEWEIEAYPVHASLNSEP